MFNLLKRSKREPIKPCGISHTVTPKEYNLEAKNRRQLLIEAMIYQEQLINSMKLNIKEQNRYHENKLRTA